MNIERANWTLKSGRDWHVAWFRESLRLIDRFTNQDSWRYDSNQFNYDQGTNLCHYVRVCVWGVVILATQVLMGALVYFSFIKVPILLFGVSGFFGTYLVLGTVALAIYALIIITNGSTVEKVAEGAGKPFECARQKFLRRDKEGVSFWSMVWKNIVTAKQAICPLITIEEDERS